MEIKWKQKNPSLKNIEDVVTNNTGYSKEKLLNDTTLYDFKDLDKVKAVLEKAKKEDIFVTVIGDYDVDGDSSSAIMDILLKEMNIRHRIRLPKRFSEGYGLKPSMIDEIDDGIIITVDNGIVAFDAIDKAKAKGLYVIVTDHHSKDASGKLPNADIIINPNAIDDQATFKSYCGAGIAYKIAEETLGANHPIMKKLLSLAAIATVADVMPLIEDNRTIVRKGLLNMESADGATFGLRAMLTESYLSKRITAEDIGFTIGPKLNAPGRLFDDGAKESMELLAYEGEKDTTLSDKERYDKSLSIAKSKAEHLAEVNKERKAIVKKMDVQVENIISTECLYGDAPLVVYVPNVNEGIIGILAGHLTEKYAVPSLVFTDAGKDADMMKGSGRSVDDINLKELLDKCKDDMVGYGGHPGAAGVTLKTSKCQTKNDKIQEFRSHLIEALGDYTPKNAEITYDLEINEDEIESKIEELDKFGPYGNQNPEPIFLIRNYKLYPKGSSTFDIYGADNEHIRFHGLSTDANAFWLAEKYDEIGRPKVLNIIGTLTKRYTTWTTDPTYGIKVIDFEEGETKERSKTALGEALFKKSMETNSLASLKNI